MFDADSQGKKEQKRYINDVSVELKEKVFTLKDVDDKLDDFKTENLFTDNEKLKIIQNLFPGHKKGDDFNKSKFNTAIQDLFINSKNFSLNKGTLNKFEKIFQFASEKLN